MERLEHEDSSRSSKRTQEKHDKEPGRTQRDGNDTIEIGLLDANPDKVQNNSKLRNQPIVQN